MRLDVSRMVSFSCAVQRCNTYVSNQRIYRPYREKLHYTWRELSHRDLFGATLSREIINGNSYGQ